MLDDLRKSHDALPTQEERSWMEFDLVQGTAIAMAVLGLAMMVGLVVSYSVSPEDIPHAVVSALSAPDAP
jgi:hypothetical protein